LLEILFSPSDSASSSRAFWLQRSGFFVPTMAVCTPGTLNVKRNAIEMLLFKSPRKKIEINVCAIAPILVMIGIDRAMAGFHAAFAIGRMAITPIVLARAQRQGEISMASWSAMFG